MIYNKYFISYIKYKHICTSINIEKFRGGITMDNNLNKDTSGLNELDNTNENNSKSVTSNKVSEVDMSDSMNSNAVNEKDNNSDTINLNKTNSSDVNTENINPNMMNGNNMNAGNMNPNMMNGNNMNSGNMNQNMMNGNNMNPNMMYNNMNQYGVRPNDKGGFLWGLLGCCIPLAGLILFLVWKDEKPKTAKSAGIGALVSVGLTFAMYIFLIVFVIALGA